MSIELWYCRCSRRVARDRADHETREMKSGASKRETQPCVGKAVSIPGAHRISIGSKSGASTQLGNEGVYLS